MLIIMMIVAILTQTQIQIKHLISRAQEAGVVVMTITVLILKKNDGLCTTGSVMNVTLPTFVIHTLLVVLDGSLLLLLLAERLFGMLLSLVHATHRLVHARMSAAQEEKDPRNADK
jgi:hypothetical protein